MNNRDISLNSMFCPLCHSSRFGPHPMQEYRREWSKCTFCGYMERIEVTKNRILSILAPDGLSEPFIDPITTEIRNKAGKVKINSNKVKCKDNSNQCNNCTCADQTN